MGDLYGTLLAALFARSLQQKKTLGSVAAALVASADHHRTRRLPCDSIAWLAPCSVLFPLGGVGLFDCCQSISSITPAHGACLAIPSLGRRRVRCCYPLGVVGLIDCCQSISSNVCGVGFRFDLAQEGLVGPLAAEGAKSQLRVVLSVRLMWPHTPQGSARQLPFFTVFALRCFSVVYVRALQSNIFCAICSGDLFIQNADSARKEHRHGV